MSDDSKVRTVKPARSKDQEPDGLSKLSERMDELASALKGVVGAMMQLRSEMDELKTRPAQSGDSDAALIQSLHERLSAFESCAPPQFRRMSPDTVKAVLQVEPCAEFEVLAQYQHETVRLVPGQKIRADRMQHLMAHVSNGLMLGRPNSADKMVEKYRQERTAREAAAAAARREAVALAQLDETKSLQGPQG